MTLNNCKVCECVPNAAQILETQRNYHANSLWCLVRYQKHTHAPRSLAWLSKARTDVHSPYSQGILNDPGGGGAALSKDQECSM